MRLRQLTIQRLPGISEAFTLEVGEGDFQVVTGPNGSGKSSLCRAARALLWPSLGPRQGVTVSARFEDEDGQWLVERDGARLEWQRDGHPVPAPRLPGSHLEACFFLALRDLLDEKSGRAPDVAAAIRRQMAGGFDLEQAADDAFGAARPQLGRPEARRLDQAEKDLRQAGREQAALAGQEEELAELLRQREESAAAARRLAHVEDAVSLAEARLHQQEWQAQLRELGAPEVLEAMTGREEQELEERDQEEERLRQREEAARRELADAGRLREDTGLAGPVAPEQLASCRRRAEALATLEDRHRRDQETLAEKERLLHQSAVPLGDRARPGEEASLADRAALFEYLGAAERLRVQEAALQERVGLLQKVDLAPADAAGTERLREAVASLREWLRAATPGAVVPSRAVPTWALLLLLGGALLVVAGLTGLVTFPGFRILAGLFAGVGLGGVLVHLRGSTGSPGGDARATAERRFGRADLAAPATWSIPAVDRRLQELETELAQADAQEMRRRDRGVEARNLEQAMATLAREREALEADHADLLRSLEVDARRLDGPLVDLLTSLDRWRRRREARDEVAARVQQQAEDRQAEQDRLARFLVPFGIDPPTDAAGAQAGLDELSRRVRQWESAAEQERRARQELAAIQAEQERWQRARAELFRRCGLEDQDRAGLIRRGDEHRRYRTLREEGRGLAARIREQETRLEKAGELALAEEAPEALGSLRDALARQAGRLEALHERCAGIQAQVEQARAGHRLEERLAVVDQCRDELEARRWEALRTRAGRFLLERVRARHEQTQAPRVLERARQLFASFTHHQYELKVSGRSDQGLRAMETRTGRGLAPSELSDGTRAQLLLAARVAFAEEADQGSGLPLFLDEALDQSDPARARAITRSLGRLAQQSGRQVFYLTSDPKDVARIQQALAEETAPPAQVHHMEEVRGRGRRATDEEDLRVPPLPEPPPVADHTAESYAVALGAPLLEPERGARDQHLLHLAWDDLPLLHRMLQAHVSRAGPWLQLTDQNPKLADLITGDSPVARQLDARARLLQRFCELWQEGRGRPADRSVLEASGAVSERYLDGLAGILADHQGDAAALMLALQAKEDPRVAGFRSNKAEELERFLERAGHLDPRPVLTRDDIQQRILAVPAAAELPAGLAAECVQRWWHAAAGGAPEAISRSRAP